MITRASVSPLRRCLLVVLASLLAGSVPARAQQHQLLAEWSRNVTEFRGQTGRRLTVVCPANGQVGPIWGTDTYTDDSPVCPAAVHAGVITPSTGGIVTIAIEPGAGSYAGSTRNGVSSQSFGAWHGGFSFVSSGEGRIDWSTTSHGLTPEVGRPVTLECPANGAITRIFGTDNYTDDSSICTAAVHAGVITTASGGLVTIDAIGPQATFDASSRNGITSSAFASWPNGFRFSGSTSAAAPTAATVARPIRPDAVARPARETVSQSGGITRVCRVFNSGTIYCRSVTSLLADELSATTPERLQASFANIVAIHHLDPGANGLVDCGSSTWTATSQTEGSMPQGGDVQGMLDACLGSLGGKMPGGGVGGFLGGLGGKTVGGGRTGAGTSCSSSGSSPVGKGNGSGAGRGGKGSESDKYLADLITGHSDHDPLRTEKDARDQVQRDQDAVGERSHGKASISYAELRDGYRAAADKSDGDVKARLTQLAEAADKLAKEQASKTEQGKRDPSGNVTGGRVGPDGDACAEVQQEVAKLIEECNRNGWTSYECMKMKSCGDPALIQPVQSADGTAGTCGAVEIFGGEAKIRQALMMQCEARSQPGPDGSTSCGGWRSEATNIQAQKACGSPYALVTETCLESGGGQVGFMTMQRSLQEVLDKGREKIGGPRITVGGGGPQGPMGPKNQPRAVTPSKMSPDQARP